MEVFFEIIIDFISFIFVELIMDRFYFNKNFNVWLRIFLTFPVTLIVLLFAFFDYKAIVNQDGIFAIAIITILMLLTAWANIKLIKKIFKAQHRKED